MSEKAPVAESKPEGADAPAAPVVRRSPGHRGQDVRDTVAEMAARAHEISLEAGSKMAAAMKDVINAAAGLTGFAIESARDLVQYMVRRGQMTQEEADKLIREAEEAHGKRPGAITAKPSYVAPDHAAAKAQRAAEKSAAAAAAAAAMPPAPVKPVVVASAPVPPPVVAKAPAAKAPATKAPAAKKVAAAPKKPAPAKGAVKRPAVAKASAKPAKKK
jgi:polyhydroxyalkanoate synthesis regulator phasin